MDYKNYSYLEDLYSIIQYQQDIIKRYEDYIETNIHQKIETREREEFSPHSNEVIHYKRITIPQADIAMVYSPHIAREWQEIKDMSPLLPCSAVRRLIMEKMAEMAKKI
jgi:hypothetical protein